MNNVEHLFMCLLAICMSSLEKCLFSSLVIFWLGLLFFWYWAASAVCIFLRKMVCYYFLPLWRLSFTLFILSFIVQKSWSLIRSHLFIFAFTCIIWEVGHRGYCCDLFQSVLPMFSSRSFFFSSRSFVISGLTFRSLIHFEFIFVYGFEFIFVYGVRTKLVEVMEFQLSYFKA